VLSGRRLPGLASRPRGARCETGILSTFAEQIFPPADSFPVRGQVVS